MLLYSSCKSVWLIAGGAVSNCVCWRAGAAAKGEPRACKIVQATYAVDGILPEQVAVKTGASALTEVRASLKGGLALTCAKG